MSHLDLLQFHSFCLTNTGSRLSQYASAIAATVREGDVVLDLGTGSGLLAVLACRAGARRVYAIESSDAVRLGELVAATTEFGPRIEFIQSLASELALDERVDVIVGDIHDTFGLQPGGLASVIDARTRLLKPRGSLIPRAIQLQVAPVEAAAFYAREIDVWATLVQGVDVSPVRPFAVNHVHAGRFDPGDLLSSPVPLGVIDLAQSTTLQIGGAAVASVRRDGVVHGICGCFVTTLADGIHMGNVPGDSGTTNFAQAFFPLDRPVPVAAGDEVAIVIDSHDGHIARWQVEISRPGQHPLARFDHSTLNGLLVSPRTLAPRTLDTFAPSPSVLPSSPVSESLSGLLHAHPSVLSRELGGETVLLNLESGVYYGLDAVGTRAWNLLVQAHTLADVCSIMATEYDVTLDALQNDLSALVRELCEKQLLVQVASNPA